MYTQILSNLQHLPLKIILSNTVKNYLKQANVSKSSKGLFSTLSTSNSARQVQLNQKVP